MKVSLDENVKDLFAKEIFKDGVLNKPGFPLPVGTRIVKDFDLAHCLISRYVEPTAEFLLSEFYRDSLQEISDDTYYGYVHMLFGKEINFSKFELKHMSLPDRREWRSTHGSDFNMECMSLRHKLLCKLSNQYDCIESHIGSLFLSLILYVSQRRPYSPFGDQVLAGYAAGGLPCAWSGDYPDGNVAVYWPHDEDPTFEENPVYPWHNF